MAKIRDYIFLHLCVMLFSFTSVFSKAASVQYNEGGLSNPLLYLFLFLMLMVCGIYALCWQRVIKRFPLNLGYANRSVYLIWSQLWAVTIFQEHLTVRNMVGLVVVLAGVIIVSLSAEHPQRNSGKEED